MTRTFSLPESSGCAPYRESLTSIDSEPQHLIASQIFLIECSLSVDTTPCATSAAIAAAAARFHIDSEAVSFQTSSMSSLQLY